MSLLSQVSDHLPSVSVLTWDVEHLLVTLLPDGGVLGRGQLLVTHSFLHNGHFCFKQLTSLGKELGRRERDREREREREREKIYHRPF